jgi:signal transduction histidine kinase
MKLSRKLTFALVFGILVVMAGYAFFQVRQEVKLSQSDLIRARRVGFTFRNTLEAIWHHEGPTRAIELVKLANAALPEVSLRVLSLADALEGPLALPLSREQWHTLRHDEGVRITEEDDQGAARGRIYVLLRGQSEPAGVIEWIEPLEVQQTFIDMSHLGIFVATIGVVAMCGLIVTIVQYRLVGRPIELLRDKARRAGAGDFSSPLVLDQRDEIGELARDLNTMCDQIAEANRQLAEATDARIKALEQLRHTDRLATVGQLAAGVAHELGTPLSVVSARAELIATNQAVAPDAQRNARVIVEQCDRIAAIIRQLLDFSRRRGATFAVVDLRSVVSRTLDLLSTAAQKTRVQLQYAPPAAPLLIRIDQNQVQQALTNIVYNGIQAMPEGGRLQVELASGRARSPDGHEDEYASITVTDEGAGIAPEHLARIFEPFFTTKGVGQGTGLGLAVAHGIVAEHGGWVDVASALGKGSRFTIYLPSGVDAAAATQVA